MSGKHRKLPLRFSQVALCDVAVGDLWANGSTITASAEATEEQAYYLRGRYPTQQLWHVESGEFWALTAPANRNCVVGRRKTGGTPSNGGEEA